MAQEAFVLFQDTVRKLFLEIGCPIQLSCASTMFHCLFVSNPWENHEDEKQITHGIYHVVPHT